MATESGFVYDETFKAENSFASSQYYAVEGSGADQVDVCDGAGDLVIGVIQDNPLAGNGATIRILGITKWVSDGSGVNIARFDKVGTDASGRAVKKSADADLVAGIALDPSTASGTVIRVLLTPGAQRAS